MRSIDERPPFMSERVSVGGYEVGLRTNGTTRTRTIVFVHGLRVSEKYFRPLAEILGAEYNVIAFDPGCAEGAIQTEYDRPSRPHKIWSAPLP